MLHTYHLDRKLVVNTEEHTALVEAVAVAVAA
jgi:hypothetical protein